MDAGEFHKGVADAEREIDKLGKRMTSFGSEMMKVGTGLTVGLSAPLALFGKASFDAFSGSEKAIKAVEQALKTMGGVSGMTAEKLAAVAEKMQLEQAVDGDEVLSKVSANLLTFGNIAGDVFLRAQQAAVDLSARLGQDLQSSTIQVGKALNDPVKGVSALQRVGVSFTADQKEMIKGMVEMNDVAGAQALILSELEKQFGGQAKAMAETSEGGVRALNLAWGEFMEQIGKVIAEFLPPLVSMLQGVVGWLQSLDDETLKWIVGLGAAAAALGPLTIGLGALVGSIGLLLPVLTTLGTGFAALVMATGPIGLFIAAATLAYTAWQLWGEQITALFTNIFSWITSAFDGLVAKVTAVTESIRASWQWLSDTLVGNSVIPDMVTMIGAEFQRLDSEVRKWTNASTSTVTKGWQSAGNTTGQIMNMMANDVKGALGKLFGDSKAAAIATAIISTAQAVARTLAAYPWPISAGMAALAAAAGAAEIATIKSTNVGSSSGGGGGGGSFSGGSAAASASAQPAQVVQQQSIAIDLQGERFGRDQVRALIEQINAAVGDGAVLRVA
jgi:hypothetical protein